MFRSLQKLNPDEAFDLVWIETGFIGDVILASAAMALSKRHFPRVRQFVVTTPLGAQVLDGCAYLDGVVVFDKRGQSSFAAFAAARRGLGKLRVACGGSFARKVLTVVPHRSYRSALLSHYLGHDRIVYDESPLSFGAVAKVSRVAVLHESARVGLLLEPLGVSREAILTCRPELTHLAGRPNRDLLPVAPPGGWVAIAPGSVWGTKRWPRQGFARVAEWLLSQTECGVVLLGSAAEVEVCRSIEKILGSSEILNDLAKAKLLNLGGKTGIEDLKFVFPRMRALLSNDSSPVHFASAYGVPTVTIFGATVPGMGFGPLSAGSETIGVSLPCRPCSDHGPKTCPLGHFKCMKELQPEQVIAAMERVLQASPTSSLPKRGEQ